MATPKFSTFLIAMVWLGFFAAIFAPFIANVSTNYNPGFDETNINTFKKLDDLSTEVQKYKNSTLDYKEKTGLTDIVGDFFTKGYQTLKIMGKSIDIFESMTYEAMDNTAFNIPAMDSLKVAIILTVTILIVIGVILKAIIKSDV